MYKNYSTIFLITIVSIIIIFSFNTNKLRINDNSMNKKTNNEDAYIDIVNQKEYINNEFGFVFLIPENWKNSVVINEEKNKIDFYYKYNEKRDAIVLSIVALTLDEYNTFKKNDKYFNANYVLDKNQSYVFTFFVPIDIPFTDKKEYEKYCDDYLSVCIKQKEIKKRFKIIRQSS